MLSRWFSRKAGAPVDPADSRIREQRLRVIAGSSAAERAAEMLTANSALMQLSHQEARAVVAYMRPRKIPEGTTFIREGDTQDTGFMLLVLDGEVTVAAIVVSRTAPITVTVLGPGSLIGEMGLLDGSPRSASCIAMSNLRCAMLTREGLNQLLYDDARTAAKLMMAISLGIANRMRESQEKLKLYAQLTQAMNEEINDLMPL
jgi:CRP/FNR family transcriptional regulator, cyclic AMP receptor protein